MLLLLFWVVVVVVVVMVVVVLLLLLLVVVVVVVVVVGFMVLLNRVPFLVILVSSFWLFRHLATQIPLLIVVCFPPQQHASVSQRRTC